jgi:hypothetical protein
VSESDCDKEFLRYWRIGVFIGRLARFVVLLPLIVMIYLMTDTHHDFFLWGLGYIEDEENAIYYREAARRRNRNRLRASLPQSKPKHRERNGPPH